MQKRARAVELCGGRADISTYLSFPKVGDLRGIVSKFSNFPGKKLQIFLFRFSSSSFSSFEAIYTYDKVLGTLFPLVNKLSNSVENCRSYSEVKNPFHF